MSTALSDTAKDPREYKRLRAWELSEQGWKQSRIAEALNVTRGAVSQWLRKGRERGVEALRSRKAPGPKSRLSAEQLSELPTLLAQGAESFGFRGDIWTRERVATLIQQRFGVKYDPSHISRLLRRCGWSSQKPQRQASQRDEAAIARWAAERWPEVKKRPLPAATP